MRFVGTRGGPAVGFGEALSAGIAPDGGLYIPERLPVRDLSDFDGAHRVEDVAAVLLQPFFAGTSLESTLTAVVDETFGFPIPLRTVRTRADGTLAVLELFHGPTAAFKDVGARFLAACLERIVAAGDDRRPVLILVATSGDTGGAVAAAFHGRAAFEVAVLFPKGRVSERQQHQLTCWGENVTAFAVDGSFDDCQAAVKAAFVDPELRERYRFSSANSINIGRLLPQSVYYAAASLEHWRRSGNALSFVIPTGNLGNGLAAVLARASGLPIGDIVFATNANRTIPDYLASGRYEARSSVATLASAMDVGDPSNLERLRKLFGDAGALRELLSAVAVDDAAIREQIRADAVQRAEVWCPHTATAAHVYDGLDKTRKRRDWAIVATAHPAKFESIVEPLVGHEIAVPDALARLLSRPSSCHSIGAGLDALADALAAR